MPELNKFSRYLITWLFIWSLAPYSWGSDFKVPPLEGPIQDEAHIFSANTVVELSNWLRFIHDRGGPQVQVLSILDLGDHSIEEASIKVVETWKLGGEKSDNGVLLLIAPKNRKLRIEVGQGLEGVLPDVIAKRIIRDRISPFFKTGDYDLGLTSGLVEIVKIVAPQYLKDANNVIISRGLQDSELKDGPREYPISGNELLFALLLLIIFFNFFGRGGPWRGSGLGRGGWSGRSSGGGWSGGGGGFSGGGASGDW